MKNSEIKSVSINIGHNIRTAAAAEIKQACRVLGSAFTNDEDGKILADPKIK